jgi:hypothetical protein
LIFLVEINGVNGEIPPLIIELGVFDELNVRRMTEIRIGAFDAKGRDVDFFAFESQTDGTKLAKGIRSASGMKAFSCSGVASVTKS